VARRPLRTPGKPISPADNGFSAERLLRAFHRQFAGRDITLREVGAW